MEKFKLNDSMVCPHCSFIYEEPVQDFSIGGRIGPDSTYQTKCDNCDRYFLVTRISETDFEVDKK